MSTGCEFYGGALVELAADALEPGRAEQVRAHVDGCSDCQEELAVIRAVRSAPAPVPDGLEARLQAAVLGVAAGSVPADSEAGSAPGPARRSVGYGLGHRPASRFSGWRPWALPLAAAAALVLWLGANQVLVPAGPGDATTAESTTVYDPYGALPGTDGEVAGELVLSDLSVEELEALLEEME